MNFGKENENSLESWETLRKRHDRLLERETTQSSMTSWWMVVAMMAAVGCVENGLVRLESSTKGESYDLPKMCKKNGMQNIRFFDDSSRETQDIKQLESSQTNETLACSRLQERQSRVNQVNGQIHCHLQDRRKISSTIVFAKPLIPSLRSRQQKGSHGHGSAKEASPVSSKNFASKVRCDSIGVRTRRRSERKPCHLYRVCGGTSSSSSSSNNNDSRKRPDRSFKINGSLLHHSHNGNSRRASGNGLTLRAATLQRQAERCRSSLRMGVLCTDHGCSGDSPCSCVDVSTGSPRPASLPSPPSPGIQSRKRSADMSSPEDSNGVAVTRRCLQRSPSAGSINGCVYHVLSRSKANSDISSATTPGQNGLNGLKLVPHDHSGKMCCSLELDLKSQCSKCMDHHHHPNHLKSPPSSPQTHTTSTTGCPVASTSSSTLTHSQNTPSSNSSHNLRKGSTNGILPVTTSSVLSPSSTGSSSSVGSSAMEIVGDSGSPSSRAPVSLSSPLLLSLEQRQKQELQQRSLFAQGTLPNCEGSTGTTCHGASASTSNVNRSAVDGVTPTTNKNISVSSGDTFPNLRQRSHSGNNARRSSASGVSSSSSSLQRTSSVLSSSTSSSSSSSSLSSTSSSSSSSSTSNLTASSKQQAVLPKSKSLSSLSSHLLPSASPSPSPSPSVSSKSLVAATTHSAPSSPSAASSSSSSSSSAPATVQCKWRGCCQALDASDVLEHVRRHSEAQIAKEKYACLWTDCKVYGKAAWSASWLERHVVTHSGHRPFKCILPKCGQRFPSQAALEKHVNGHFAASGQGAAKPARSKEEVHQRLWLKRKKQLKRRSVQSVKTNDFFDGETMATVKQELLSLTQYADTSVSNAPLQVTFQGTVFGRRTNSEGSKQSLVGYSPPNVLDSRWVSEKNVKNTMEISVPLAFLPHDTVANLHQSLYRPHRFRKHRRK